MSLEKFCQIEDAGVIAVPIPMENFRPQQQPQQPVNFSSCQQILMKTFQNYANTPLITKTAFNFFGHLRSMYTGSSHSAIFGTGKKSH